MFLVSRQGKTTEKQNFLCLENAVAGRQVVSEEIVWFSTNQQTVKQLAIWFLLLDKKYIIMKENHNIYYTKYWQQWWLNFITMHPVTLFIRKPLLCS